MSWNDFCFFADVLDEDWLQMNDLQVRTIMFTCSSNRLLSTVVLFLQVMVFSPSFADPLPQAAESETGLASYYHDRYHGKRTASGEIYRKNKFTAAHKTLPFGTLLRVTNEKNKRSVIVRVNDRGRLHKVTLDLSKAAANKLKIIRVGIARVSIQIMSLPKSTKQLARKVSSRKFSTDEA